MQIKALLPSQMHSGLCAYEQVGPGVGLPAQNAILMLKTPTAQAQSVVVAAGTQDKAPAQPKLV